MLYMGIDLGGTNIAAAIVNEKFEIVARAKVPTGAHRPPEEIVADMGKLCLDLMESQGLTVADFHSAGIGTPGIADTERGVVDNAHNLGMYNNFPLVELLRSHVPFEKIFLANDANAAAYGEALCGAAKGAKNAIMVTLGTGVGGGIVLDGKLYTGFNFAAGELGHMAIVYDGLPCTCGQKGCWEAYSSATALIKHTREVMQENPDSLMWKESATLDAVDGRTAFEASKKGDAAAQAVVDWYVGHLACGIINLLNIFQPDVLCIGGGICGEGDYLLRPLQALVEKNQFMTDVSLQSKLRIATLGNDAGILGAALLGLQA